MKKLIFIILLLPLLAISQETVGVNAATKHVYSPLNEVTYVKMYREYPAATALTIDFTFTLQATPETTIALYEWSDTTNDYTTALSLDDTVTLESNEQSVWVKVVQTTTPSADETFTVTINDTVDYNLIAGESAYTIHSIATPLLTAFPGAIGAGKYAGSRIMSNTWRGKNLYIVTNLDNSGDGSFEQGLSDASVGIITFAVAGEIVLPTGVEGRMAASNSGKLILGQTAPGDGIIFTGYTSNNGVLAIVGKDNIVWRYCNFDFGNTATSNDTVFVSDSNNIYFDHCSVLHGMDEMISITAQDSDKQVTQITVAYTHIADGKYDYPTTGKYNHNTGGLWGAIPDDKGTFTEQRYPRANYVGYFTAANNLSTGVSHRIFNHQSDQLGENFNNVIGNNKERITQEGYPQAIVNYEGNWIQPGQNSLVAAEDFNLSGSWLHAIKPQEIYFNYDGQFMPYYHISGNVLDGYLDENDTQTKFVTYWTVPSIGGEYDANQILANRFLMPHGNTPTTALDAFNDVTGVNGAGSTKRVEADGSVSNSRQVWYQTQVDYVIADKVNSTRLQPTYPDPDNWGTNRPIFASSTYPNLITLPTDPNYRKSDYDSDADGMGDAWETATYGNLSKDGTADTDADGYLDLEEFANLVDITISATGVSILPSTGSLDINQTLQISTTFTPTNTTDKTGVWTTSNASFATVSAGGLVTGIGQGVATITFTSNDGSFTDTSVITVSDVVATDTENPTDPTNAIVSAITNTTATVTWTASTDNVGVVGYYIKDGATTISDVTGGVVYNFSGLVADTTYSYDIIAYDLAGNQSNTLNFGFTTTNTQSPPIQGTGATSRRRFKTLLLH